MKKKILNNYQKSINNNIQKEIMIRKQLIQIGKEIAVEEIDSLFKNNTIMTIYFIILMAGMSERSKSRINTRLIKDFNFITPIEKILNEVTKNVNINNIIIVHNNNDRNILEQIIENNDYNVTINLLSRTKDKIRFNSIIKVINFLKKESTNDNDLILIHDGNRPYINNNFINQIILGKTSEFEGVIPLIPCVNSPKIKENNTYVTIAKENVVFSQTPQLFSFEILKNVIQKCGSKI